MAIYEPLTSDGSDGPRRLQLRSPVTLEPIGELACASAAEVRGAVERARKAQADWGALPVEERAKFLQRVSELILENPDRITDTVLR